MSKPRITTFVSSVVAMTVLFALIFSGREITAQIPGIPTPPSVMDGALKAQAFWIDRKTVLIPVAQSRPDAIYKIFSDPNARIGLSPKAGLAGKYSVALLPSGELTAEQSARFPKLSKGYYALAFPAGMNESVEHMLLKGQLAISVQKPDGSLTYVTGVQFAGVLDDLYAYRGALGVVIHRASNDIEWDDFPDTAKGDAKVKVWAPTAQSMALQMFDRADQATPTEILPMKEHNGVWVGIVDKKWIGKYYLLDENVYSRAQFGMVENIVTDPYSIDISINGGKSRLLDIDSPDTKPDGWDADRSPPLANASDLSIYELHIRDFSIGDQTVPVTHRGMYAAFGDAGSDGMKHLQSLAMDGLRVVHLLPSFHFAGVNEDKGKWKSTPDLGQYPADSMKQQAAINPIRDQDAYNWGYNPIHYFAPEGSYAVDPDKRVLEYRAMVQSLHKTGLRVVQDVVFNHTADSGQAANSVLDKVVPSYYNRFDANGQLYTATCCADTASENLMFAKLQEDAIVWNAKHYKIDGFRFDLMGFTFVPNLRKLRVALDELTVEKDGVDGSKIYVYGEGWEFGETAKGAYGRAATQLNLYGVGVGTFNDRLRDAVRGGGPSGEMRPQGFATGLFTDPAKYSGAPSADKARATLAHEEDLIRVGLSGNLRDYSFTDSTGAQTTGGGVNYGGKPAGYTAVPAEAITYVSAHDNQILFDAIQLKSAANDDTAMRARRQVLAMSIVALGQGIPFFVAGDDLLRSKDMDADSYNSGDWFNKIDWTGSGNNWGVGLPRTGHEEDWFIEKPLLSKPALKPSTADIAATYSAFRDLLKIRYSSGLFRMPTFAEVQKNLTFPSSSVPGLLIMRLDAPSGGYGPYRHILVLFNATNSQQTYTSAQLKGIAYFLHPIQQQGADAQVRTCTFDAAASTASVPALTTAVFVSYE